MRADNFAFIVEMVNGLAQKGLKSAGELTPFRRGR